MNKVNLKNHQIFTTEKKCFIWQIIVGGLCKLQLLKDYEIIIWLPGQEPEVGGGIVSVSLLFDS